MINVILGLIIVAIVGAAILYIRKEKKRGVRCVGCPDGGMCGGNCSGCSGGTNVAGNNAEECGEDTDALK